ncbi:MAG: hypothetical protein KAJ20_01040 [Candidatus Aenigmarchaeota archaeon]|nr:hypothetical protein [Candidatus Aenigmarchaeota archaeon]MCK5372902.1 hypothetical protein [Candidatus Aenigmarchaeota archaeon]
MDPLIIGLPGMAFILIAFILDDFHILSVDSQKSINLNIAGSALLAVYAYIISSIPFLILNSVWLTFAIYKMYKTATKHHQSI